MLALRPALQAFILFLFLGCQAVPKNNAMFSQDTNSINRNVSELNPDLPSNQLSNEDAYGQLIVTVDSDEVINEIKEIKEIAAAIQELHFLRSNNSFQSLVYVIQFKRNINPIPYHNFIESYEGVLGVEFDGIIGLADTMNYLPEE